MPAKRTKRCLQCGDEFDRWRLSRKGYCYSCGRGRMIEFYEVMWAMKRDRSGGKSYGRQ